MKHRILAGVAAILVIGALSGSSADAYTCSTQGSQCVCTSGSGYCSDCNPAGCVDPDAGVSCCAGGAGSGHIRHPTP